MYQMSEPVTIMETPFNLPSSNGNSKDIMKNWLKELTRFRITPNQIYKSKILWKAYQYLVIFPCRLYGQGSIETFPQSWVIALDQLAREGKPCNSSSMLAHKLKEQVARAQKSPEGMQAQIYMFTYILDAICAPQEFVGLKWASSPVKTTTKTFSKLLSKCSFRGVITWLSNHFSTLVY